jgi:hypothetical protein
MSNTAEFQGNAAVRQAIPARSRQAIPDLLDLTGYYTHGLGTAWPGAAGLDLSALPAGIHAHDYSAFDIRGRIQLAGTAAEVESGVAPVSVTVAVGLKGRRLHLLQGVCGRVVPDTLVGVYALNYVDGQSRSIPMTYERNVRDLAVLDQAPLTDATVIALAANGAGRQVQLARYVANNPRPQVEIASIDFVSALAGPAPCLVAAPLERNDPTYEWFDSVGIYNNLVPRSPEATADQVDLTDYYSASLDDDWFHHGGHDLHDVPRDLPELAGVKFDVRGLIVLGSAHSLEITGLALPEELLGIPVHRMGRAVHFLQACAFASDPAPRSASIASIWPTAPSGWLRSSMHATPWTGG